MIYLPVSVVTFGLAFEDARKSALIAESTSPFESSVGALYALAVDGLSGYVVRADGELTNVFSLERGRGDGIVTSALSSGAVYLDCFDGYLPTFYARHGFETVRREPNWTPGGPDVVHMSLPGYADRVA